MVKSVDYTNELIDLCIKHKIELIGEYKNVKNTTPIYFKCGNCGIQVKKSYKILVSNRFCHYCFRLIHH